MCSGCFSALAVNHKFDGANGNISWLWCTDIKLLAGKGVFEKQHCWCWQSDCFAGNSIAGVGRATALRETALPVLTEGDVCRK